MAESPQTCTVTVVSSDAVSFRVNPAVVRISTLISSMGPDPDMVDDEDEEELEDIPLPNVDGKTLQSVLQYCEAYHSTPHGDLCVSPRPGDTVSKFVPSWFAEFMNSFGTDPSLFRLWAAASYLDIAPLVELISLHVACVINTIDVNSLGDVFHVTEELTDAEKKQIQNDASWIKTQRS